MNKIEDECEQECKAKCVGCRKEIDEKKGYYVRADGYWHTSCHDNVKKKQWRPSNEKT